jgi:hypothetical protein
MVDGTSIQGPGNPCLATVIAFGWNVHFVGENCLYNERARNSIECRKEVLICVLVNLTRVVCPSIQRIITSAVYGYNRREGP